MDSRRARQVAQMIAIGRIGFGVLALVRPGRLLRPWIGDRSGDRGALVLGRAVGARDLALGAGVVMAARHGSPVRGWVEAGGAADLADTTATLIAFDELPRPSRWMVLALAGGSAAAAFLVGRQLED